MNDDSFEMMEDGPADETEVESMTAAELLQRLEEAWLNERMCPEILPPCQELIDCVLEQIENMEQNLQQTPRTDLRASVHRIEILRIRFLVSSYLRARIKKIEHFSHNLLKDPAANASLTAAELNFVHEFTNNIDEHMKGVALRHLPGGRLQAMPTESNAYPAPNLDAHVFVKVKEDTNGVLVADPTGNGRDEEVDLEKGSQHVMQYRNVAPLVKDNTLVLF